MAASTHFNYYLYDNGEDTFDLPYSFKLSNKKLSSISLDNKLTVNLYSKPIVVIIENMNISV